METEIWYWGDLDSKGLEILSDFRRRFPRTKSFLMDEIIIENNHDTLVEYVYNIKDVLPEYLDPGELKAYDRLTAENNGKRLRLEQEKLPIKLVDTFLSNLEYFEN